MSYEKSLGKGNTIHKSPLLRSKLRKVLSFLRERLSRDVGPAKLLFWSDKLQKKSGRTKSRVLQLMVAETVLWNDDF